MKTLNLIQGTPEWHAHRATHFNASDAPAMMGCSPYKTRTQLLRELKTGITPEVDAGTQCRFDDGHRFEALARNLAEEIIGEDLYPVTGSEGELSASFDGLSMDEATNWEHKHLNTDLRDDMVDGCTGADLAPMYRIQMEQQCMVSGCERVLFMASKWNGDALVEEFHCWYTPDMDLRAQIVAGWKQLATDLATYEPAPIAPVVVAEAMKSLPAVSVRLDGKLAVVSNLPDFSTALRAFIAHIPKLPDTDQEFANAESACKALKRAEDALTAGEASALAEMTDFEAMRRTVRDLKELARTTRLATEKLVAARKEQLRREIVAGGVSVLREHVEVLNTRLDKPYMPQVDADIGGAIRGKKNLNSMRDAVSVEVARAKIEASEIAARIQINLDTMLRLAGSYTGMFPDATTLVLKQPDDFEAQVQARVTRRKEEDQAQLDAGRERIRAQEQAKAQPEADENVAAAARTAAASPVPAEAKYPRGGHTTYPAPTTAQFSGREWAAQPAGDRELPHHQVYGSSPVPTANVVPMRTTAPIARTTPPSLKLGQLAERLGFTLTADFLRTIGFEPAAKERGATLYHDVDFSLICAALVKHINQVQALKAA